MAASVWGKVPGIGWPTSFLGLAYFFAALVVWCMVRGGPSSPLRYVARLGALISVGFGAVILLEGYACPYCLVAVRAAHKLAAASLHVRASMIVVTEFPFLVVQYGAQSVPHIVINEEHHLRGALSELEILDKILEVV